MPNMDGTGPRWNGRHTGRGNGWNGGAGRGFAGCRCGLGPCAAYPRDEKTDLTARKEALQRSLNSIEERLQEL